MKTFLLGGEIEVLRIGLGTNRIADDDASRAILPLALEQGVNLIDTADIYARGTSERVIGREVGGDPRAVVATKGGYFGASPEKISAAIDDSLRRLGSKTIDLYYLHRPQSEIPIEQSVDPIVSARQDGRVRHIGLSNVTIDQIDRVRRLTPIAAVENAYNCESASEQEDVIDYCERNEIAFVAHSPLRGSARAEDAAGRAGVPRTRLVLAAMLARSPVVVPIPGTRNPAHLESNLAALELDISKTDAAALGFGRRAPRG